MKCISNNCRTEINKKVWQDAESKYGIVVQADIKEFLELNNGGYPKKDIIESNGEEYEVRAFLSLDEGDKEYYIEKPLNYFLENTKGKIIPIGIDSGDNYYCVNNETGKIYYWSAGVDQYYCIAENIDVFIEL